MNIQKNQTHNPFTPIFFRNNNQVVPNCSTYDIPVIPHHATYSSFLQYDHTPHEYKNNHRSIKNWLGTTCIPVDIDNKGLKEDDYMTEKQIRTLFPDVSFVLCYSRSHMKWKNGESPRPKFHIYFILKEKITCKNTYLALVEQLKDKFTVNGIAYADPAVFGLSSCFFGVENPQWNHYEGEKTILDVLEQPVLQKIKRKTKRNRKTKQKTTKQRASNSWGKYIVAFCKKYKIPVRVYEEYICFASAQEKTKFGYSMSKNGFGDLLVHHAKHPPQPFFMWVNTHHKTITEPFVQKEKVITVKNYATELTPKKINRLFLKQNTTFLQANTGSGKTSMLLQMGQKHNILYAVPSTTTVTSMIKKTYRNDPTRLITEDFQLCYEKNYFDPEKTQKSVIGTYDKISQIALNPEKYGINPKTTILIVDEAHQLTTCADYREDALTPLFNAVQNKQFKNAILVSATFNTELQNCMNIIPDQNIFIEVQNEQTRNLIWEQTTPKITRKEKLLQRIEDTFKEKKNGKIIVFNNNKKQNNDWANATGKRTVQLNANTKHDPKNKQLLQEDMIPEDVDIIFMTSMATEAINFNNEDITTIYCDERLDVITLKQFAARPRKQDSAKHYIIGDFFKKDLNHQFIQKEKFKMNTVIEVVCQELEELKNTSCYTNSEENNDNKPEQLLAMYKTMHKNWKKESVMYDKKSQKFVPNPLYVAKLMYKKVKENQLNLPTAKNTLNEFKMNLISVEENNRILTRQEEERLEKQREKWKKQEKETIKALEAKEKRNRKRVIKEVANYSFEEIKRRKEEISHIDLSDFQEQEMIDHRVRSEAIIQFLELYEKQIHHEDALEIVLNNKTNDTLTLMEITEKPKQYLLHAFIRKHLKVGKEYTTKQQMNLVLKAEKFFVEQWGFIPTAYKVKNRKTKVWEYTKASVIKLLKQCGQFQTKRIRKMKGKKKTQQSNLICTATSPYTFRIVQ